MYRSPGEKQLPLQVLVHIHNKHVQSSTSTILNKTTQQNQS